MSSEMMIIGWLMIYAVAWIIYGISQYREKKRPKPTAEEILKMIETLPK